MNDLDRRAALALGWTYHGADVGWQSPPIDGWRRHELNAPSFSTDMNAAMELEAFAFKREYFIELQRWSTDTVGVRFTGHGNRTKWHKAKAPATAITLAFLELYESGKLGEKK